MKLIAVTDNGWAIGKNGHAVFSLPGDLKFFKEKTLGHTIVMGRKTFISLPSSRPLPGRKNVILTRDPFYSCDGTVICHSISELISILGTTADEAYVIGGGEIYDLLLPYCDIAYITKVDTTAEGTDTFMPDLDKAPDWTVTDKSDEYEENGLRYRFVTYKRTRVLC